MLVFNDLKTLFHSKFPFFFPVQSLHIHPFSHIPIFSNNFTFRSKHFSFSHTRILLLSLFLLMSFTLFPPLSSSHLHIISEAWSATYYVDAANGNDANNGTSELTTWKTIAKVNASRFKPGDQILFKRGGGCGGDV